MESQDCKCESVNPDEQVDVKPVKCEEHKIETDPKDEDATWLSEEDFEEKKASLEKTSAPASPASTAASGNNKQQTYHRHPKPPFSYIALIAMAIRDSQTGKMTLAEINDYLMKKFPFFRGSYTGWKNSVRHNLSLNECFTKVLRDPSRPWGKDNFWTINPNSEYTFADGIFRRRRKRISRKSRAAQGRRKFQNGNKISEADDGTHHAINPERTGLPKKFTSPFAIENILLDKNEEMEEMRHMLNPFAAPKFLPLSPEERVERANSLLLGVQQQLGSNQTNSPVAWPAAAAASLNARFLPGFYPFELGQRYYHPGAGHTNHQVHGSSLAMEALFQARFQNPSGPGNNRMVAPVFRHPASFLHHHPHPAHMPCPDTGYPIEGYMASRAAAAYTI